MELVFKFEAGTSISEIQNVLTKAASGFASDPSLGQAAPKEKIVVSPFAAAPKGALKVEKVEKEGAHDPDENHPHHMDSSLDLDIGDEDSASEEEVTEEPKRGRGRPRKEPLPKVKEVEDDADLTDDLLSDSESDLGFGGLDDEEEAPKPAKKSAAAAPAKAAAPVIDKTAIGKVVMAYSTRHGKDQAKALLAKFKAKTASEIDPKHYAAFYAAAQK